MKKFMASESFKFRCEQSSDHIQTISFARTFISHIFLPTHEKNEPKNRYRQIGTPVKGERELISIRLFGLTIFGHE